jgi:hypothetical protein
MIMHALACGPMLSNQIVPSSSSTMLIYLTMVFTHEHVYVYPQHLGVIHCNTHRRRP